MTTYTRRLISRLAAAGIAVTAAGTATGLGAPVAHAATPAPTASAAAATANASPSATAKPSTTPTPTGAPKPQAGVQQGAPVPPVPSTTLPSSTCTLNGTERDCDLYAREGAIQPAGAPGAIPVWSFSLSASDPVVLPGATLVVNQGESVRVTLHNNLSAADGNVSLEVPGSSLVPDQAGVAAGATADYTLTGLGPGTYIYQAGSTQQGSRQVAMGLAGILVVRPAVTATQPNAATTAEGTDATAFTAETTVALSEIDPVFNAAPLSHDLANYRPQYFLLNGQAYGGATPVSIAVNPSDNLLLRYANLGLVQHAMTLLNQRQLLIEEDSHASTNVQENNLEFLPPGATANTLTSIDPQMKAGDSIALYDQTGSLYNGAADPGLGGMMAVLTVVNAPGGNPAGPTTHVDVTPLTNDGTAPVNVAVASSSSTLTDQEWFLDNIGDDGTGHHFTSGATPGCATTFCIPAADLLTYLTTIQNDAANQTHTIWVHGKDGSGWGVPSGDVFDLNVSGPITASVELHRPRTNGTASNDIDKSGNVVILATGAASLSDWNVTDAEFCVDYPSCTASGKLTVNPADSPCTSTTNSKGPDSPTALCGSLPSSAIAGLSEGPHTVSVRVLETNGTNSRWGSFALPTASATLVKDTQGPAVAATPAATVSPTPNNGFQASAGNIGFLDSVLVQATFDDTATGGSPIVIAEAYLSTQPAASAFGTGAEMTPAGGAWSTSATQQARAFLPLADIRALPDGIVPIWVHGMDAAGNWGPFREIDLTLDKTAPVAPTVTGAAGATNNQRVLTITSTDPTVNGVSTGVVGGELFAGTDPGVGAALQLPGSTSPFTATVSWGTSAVPGTLYLGRNKPATISVRMRDAAGNWGAITQWTVV